MAFNVSSLAKAKELYERADKRIGKIKEEHGKTLDEALRAGVVLASTGAMGFVNGRFGGEKQELVVAGFPVDATLGLLVHAAAFTKILPEGHRVLGHSVGTGAIAAGAYRMGQRVGRSYLEGNAHNAPQAVPQQIAAGVGTPPWAQSPPWATVAPAPMAVPQGMPQPPRG